MAMSSQRLVEPCVFMWAVACVATPAAHARAQQREGNATSSAESSAQVAGSMARAEPHETRFERLEASYETIIERMEAEAIERMIQDAQNEARVAQEEPSADQREFLAGSLALQKLNPEITFCADMVANVIFDRQARFYAEESDRSGMPVRAVGLHVQHVLDPYSMFKSALHISPHLGLELEEVYVLWSGLVRSLSFGAGRFRQSFGIINRWHEHDLDQTQYPLALELVLGEEGLVGNGFLVKWMMPPLWAHANELTFEVVDGSNETLFAGEHFSVPSSMAHLKSYYDLSDSTYLELGLTGMFGFNNRRGFVGDDKKLDDEPWRQTYVAGADITLFWSPPNQARYRSFVWRTEVYYANREVPPTSARDTQHSWGAYSYVQYQLSARWFVGARGDVVLPTIRTTGDLAWDAVPYVTFWQSEFVYLRLEYRHGQKIPFRTPDQNHGRRVDNRLLFQIDFAAGPHKHEKY